MDKAKIREQLAPIAHHEAGHAVIAVAFEIEIGSAGVTIIPADGTDGMAWTRWRLLDDGPTMAKIPRN